MATLVGSASARGQTTTNEKDEGHQQIRIL